MDGKTLDCVRLEESDVEKKSVLDWGNEDAVIFFPDEPFRKFRLSNSRSSRGMLPRRVSFTDSKRIETSDQEERTSSLLGALSKLNPCDADGYI